MQSGKLIVIEGIDGTGKGTQHKKLFEKLKSRGIPCVTVDFPQYDSSMFGKLLGEAQSGKLGEYANIPPKIISVVYAADRMKAREFITENLHNGIHVLANRYTLSNAHQVARVADEERAEFLSWLYEMEFSERGFRNVVPDLNIFLDVPPEISRELILKKSKREYLSGAPMDELENDINNQIETAKVYRLLASREKNVTRINCAPEGALLPPERVHEMVYLAAQSVIWEGQEGKILRERQM